MASVIKGVGMKSLSSSFTHQRDVAGLLYANYLDSLSSPLAQRLSLGRSRLQLHLSLCYAVVCQQQRLKTQKHERHRAETTTTEDLPLCLLESKKKTTAPERTTETTCTHIDAQEEFIILEYDLKQRLISVFVWNMWS